MNFEKLRLENQNRWEASAREANDKRPFLKKVIGKDSVSAEDLMMEEANADNFKFVKPKHVISEGNFVCGLDRRTGLPIISESIREIQGMPDSLLRIDFPEQSNNLTIRRISEELESLSEEDQREYLTNKIQLRRLVFDEIESLGIAVPRFKSFIAKQYSKLKLFTVVRRVEGKVVFLDELSEEMAELLIDYYFKLGDYFLDKSNNLSWESLLRDVKGHQLMYGSVLNGPKKLYYVDIGMESVAFVGDYKDNPNKDYVKANLVYHRVKDLLNAIGVLEKELGENGKERIAGLREKINVVLNEAHKNMIKFSMDKRD